MSGYNRSDVNTPVFLVSGGRADLYASRAVENGSSGRLYHFATIKDGQSFYEPVPLNTDGGEWLCVIKCAAGASLTGISPHAGTEDLRERFTAFTAGLESAARDEDSEREAKKLGAKKTLEAAVTRLTNVNEKITGNAREDLQHEPEAVRLCAVLCEYLKLELKTPPACANQREDDELIDEILYLSGIRYRRALLGEHWWTNESGVLLASLKDGSTVALLPNILSGYSMYNASSGETSRVTAETATLINPAVKAVFRTFPPRRLGVKDVAAFLLGERMYVDIAKILFFSLLAAFAQILPPILSARIFDTVIPGAMYGLLLELIFILLAFGVAGIGFSVLINLGLSRVNTKLDIALQAAVWDRLLSLKASLFHKFTAGELLERVKGLDTVRQALSPDLMKKILSALFSLVNVYVLFRYNSKIAPYTMLLLLFALAVSVPAWRYKYKLTLRFEKLSGKTAGINNQIMNGIERIKASAAEERVFALWSRHEEELRYLRGRVVLADHFLASFYIFYEFASAAFVFLLMFSEGSDSMGSFIAFISSFMIFQRAILELLKSAGVFPELVPLLKGVAPIFKTPPEYGERKTAPGGIDGSLEFNHVSFKYSQYGRNALSNVSFKLHPGESLGIIGISGSGKSSLMRLLLGFYQLTEGKIYVGGYDMETIDLRYLRRSMSVFLQNGRLIVGSIFDNISEGDPSVDEEAVMEAVRAVELEKDIESLPHGLYTRLDPWNNLLSSGQKQKLLLARAIAKKRHYLLLDEATSSLDSIAQTKIMKNINSIAATKIIIAQRISTVSHCDKIIVLDGGCIVKEGTYSEIVNESNVFDYDREPAGAH